MDKDLLVIGGGINGVGIAADAAGRGLKVLLCEMGDLASATSAASSKLIHGGLRYLENYDFKLVRESLQERSILRRLAPHLVKLQPFIFPYCPWLRPYWMIRAGLFVYDHLAYDPNIPSSKAVPAADVAELELLPQYNKALRYYDCTEDDSRLVLHVALLAKQHGAEILTRTKLVKASRKNDGWVVTLVKNNAVKVYHVQAIVNATGPWVQQVTTDILQVKTPDHVKLVKGSHIIVPKLFKHNEAFTLQNSDDRVVFLIPYLHEFTLIGTTEVLLDQIEYPTKASDAEVAYLCDITNQFVKHPITPQDVIAKYAGIRPLLEDAHTKASEITRDYAIDLNATIPQAPVISIFGGKITTYRHLAESVMDQLSPYFSKCGKAWTKHAYLPGGHFLKNDVDNFKNYLINVYPTIPSEVLMHYVNNYGTRAGDILRDVRGLDDLGIYFGAQLYQREVDYLIEHEWAQTASDILWRRGKMGMWFKPDDVKNLENYLSAPPAPPQIIDLEG